MYYVYVLRNPLNGDPYIGYSADLRQRVRQHEQSEHPGWELVYYEAFLSQADARDRERKLKHHGSAWRELRQRIAASLSF